MSQRIRFFVRSDAVWVALMVGLVLAWSVWGLVARHGDMLETTAPTVALVAYALVLGATASVYYHWRLSSSDDVAGLTRRLSGWLVVGLALAALPELLLMAFKAQTSRGSAGAGPDSWLLVTQVVIVLLLIVFTRVSERIDPLGDPALAGGVAGLVITAGACVLMAARPDLRLGTDGTALGAATLVLGSVVLASSLLHHTLASLWVRRRLAVAGCALIWAQAAGHLDGAPTAVVAIVLNLLGALVLCATALRLLRDRMLEYRDEVLLMHSAFHDQEVLVLEQRELLHELGATLAGIGAAAELIRLKPSLPEPRRRRLEGMLDSEVGRLMRLMGDHSPTPVIHDFEVDQVVGNIVLSHQTRGLDVRWRPSRLTAHGCADDLAEVVNILLENAARHAGGAPVTVTATSSNGTVQIACSDKGPGVPAELRARLFETGVRGPRSRGQGLGLSMARRLLARQEGSLVFRQTTSAGATFVVRIPEHVAVPEVIHGVVHAS